MSYRCPSCGQEFMSRAVYERHVAKCREARREAAREEARREGGQPRRDVIVDVGWVGRRVRVRLVSGEELEGRIVDIARYEVALEGCGVKRVVLKHSILYFEPLEG